MKLPSIVELAKGEATFVRYEDGTLWYEIFYNDHDSFVMRPFEFPIQVYDTGKEAEFADAGGVFDSRMKGVTLMRWIRKHLELLNEARKESEAQD